MLTEYLIFFIFMALYLLENSQETHNLPQMQMTNKNLFKLSNFTNKNY